MATLDTIMTTPELETWPVIVETPHEGRDSEHTKLEGDLTWDGLPGMKYQKFRTIYPYFGHGQEVHLILTNPGQPFISFYFAVDDPKRFGRSELTITLDGGRFPSGTQVACLRAPDVSGSWVVYVMRTPASGIPFGIWGKLSFTIDHYDGGGLPIQVDQTAPVEVYAISVKQPLPYIFSQGIHLSLLRMFALPVMIRNLQTEDDYLTTVVRIVHGSATPFNGEPSDTRRHWLKYESNHGRNSFTNSLGDNGLNIPAWLDAWRLHDQLGILTTVNCYDQAAATEVALTLGIFYARLHWEYHGVYGFIRPGTELVGWGPCNNPYFEGNVSRMTVPDKDPMRYAFRNHAFLSWSAEEFTPEQYLAYNSAMDKTVNRKDTFANASQILLAYLKTADEQVRNFHLKMIDACAGPHLGTESRFTYEMTKDLVELPYSDNGYKSVADSYQSDHDRWLPRHYLGPGINMSSIRGIPAMGSALGKAYNEANDRVKAVLSAEHGPSDLYIPASQLQDVDYLAEYNFRILRDEMHWEHLDLKVPIRAYKTDAGMEIWETKFISSANHADFLSVKSGVGTNAQTSIEDLSRRLAMDTVTTGTVHKDQTDLYKTDPLLGVVGPDGLQRIALAYTNYTLEIVLTPKTAIGLEKLLQGIVTMAKKFLKPIGK